MGIHAPRGKVICVLPTYAFPVQVPRGKRFVLAHPKKPRSPKRAKPKKAAREAKKAVNPGVVAEKLDESPNATDSDISVSPERFSSM